MGKKKLTVSGPTVQAAAVKGLKVLGLPKEQVTFRVLQRETNGLFGSKEAVVALLYDEETAKDAIRKQEVAQFKAQFKLKYSPEKVQLQVSQGLFDEERFPRKEDRIRCIEDVLRENLIFHPNEEVIEQIADDPQAAQAWVSVVNLESHPLNDGGSSMAIRITPDAMRATAVIFFEGQEVTEEQVFEVLKKVGCVKGILRKKIQKVLAGKEESFFELARGKAAKDDCPGVLEKFFQEDEHREFAAMMEALTVDTRNVKEINIAERNQLLIRIGETQKGEDGLTVTGTVLPKGGMEEGYPLKLGQNVYTSDDEKEIFAKQAGHIQWKADEQLIDIEPVYIVEGNVDFSEGNVEGFVGKVIVKGDVRPKFAVRAEGDIEIHGSVEDAIVESKRGNVLIAGSVVHQNEGYVKAGETVQGALFTNANVEGKDIVVEKEVLNSILKAENEILVTGNPGVLVGGEAHARKSMEANVIGSESWVPTKIHIGDVSDLQKRLRTITQNLVDYEEQIKEAQTVVKMLSSMAESRELTEAQNKQMEEAQEKIEVAEADIQDDTMEQEEIHREIDMRKEGYLKVLKTLFPQVDVYVFDGYYLPTKEEGSCLLACKEGIVVKSNL